MMHVNERCECTSKILPQRVSPYYGKKLLHTLLSLNHMKIWQQCLDKKGIERASVTELLKAFESPLHDLLIATSDAYGFTYTFFL